MGAFDGTGQSVVSITPPFVGTSLDRYSLDGSLAGTVTGTDDGFDFRLGARSRRAAAPVRDRARRVRDHLAG